jgi:2-polyprenyl-3-methyl-5-hydroxy-6-metoxy-1,4-benzoquinol methylase
MESLTSPPLENEATWDRWWTSSSDFHRYHPGARHRRRLIAAMVGNALNGRCAEVSVLDVGCGDGLLLEELGASFSAITNRTGADYTPTTIEYAQQKHPTIEFKLLHLEKSALASRFDIVICAEVIEHLSDRRTAFLNLAKMLAPGGTLIVTTPQGPIFPTETYFGHRCHSSRIEMEEFAALAGLKLTRCLEWGWPTYNALKYATNIAPQKSLGAFGFKPYRWWQKAITHALYLLNFLNLTGGLPGYQLVAVFQSDTIDRNEVMP